ncbi:DUF7563 family protein [Halococcus hamelinensis]|uniref:DUF7563 family protein n=1 Tax=Halococcus hamelinensis TaxID=332168 RepID=UPI000299E5F8|nr:hypothetical protein [Halococcus hamelinensis]
MPNCNNCESFVTEGYVRVFAPSHLDTVRVCPQYPDMVREGGEVREARSPRHQVGDDS